MQFFNQWFCIAAKSAFSFKCTYTYEIFFNWKYSAYMKAYFFSKRFSASFFMYLISFGSVATVCSNLFLALLFIGHFLSNLLYRPKHFLPSTSREAIHTRKCLKTQCTIKSYLIQCFAEVIPIHTILWL